MTLIATKTKAYCRYFCFLIAVCSGVSVFADTPALFVQLFKAKQAFHSDDNITATSILKDIASECIASDNDTIKVLYYETQGSLLFFDSKYKECIEYLSKVPVLYEKIDIRNINYLESFHALGIAYQKMGDYATAERFYRKGLLKSVLINQPEKYRENIYLNLGNLYLEQNDSILAHQCFSRMNAKSLGGLVNASLSDDKILDDSELQAIKLREEGNFEAAVEAYDKILSYIKERIGTHNEDYIRNLYSKALVVGFNLGRVNDGIQICEEIISYKDYMPPCQENIQGAFAHWLQYLAFDGNREKVDSVLSEAFAYLENCPNRLEETALIYRLTGNGAYWNKHYEIAIPFYEKYIATGVREEGTSYLEIPNMLAVAYIFSGSHSKAISLLSSHIKRYKQDIDGNLNLKCQILHNLGRAYMLEGDKKKALTYLIESNEIFKSVTGEENPKTSEYITACQE
ncbi:tetratricopeptide repeat protein [uncultured Muribaculum sp.]|uniref:tetratricopeptide repeat protein n=1 Tax=uncultured Muribaculum sp. TaxID=1918613 RepID=UPI00273161F3|nr:tetratricopeptide repeat protein [uncultured Muribaculum sp.]